MPICPDIVYIRVANSKLGWSGDSRLAIDLGDMRSRLADCGEVRVR